MTKDYSCPVCGARNLEVVTWEGRPVLWTDRGEELKYVVGTYYCTVCSKGGIITAASKKQVSGEQG